MEFNDSINEYRDRGHISKGEDLVYYENLLEGNRKEVVNIVGNDDIYYYPSKVIFFIEKSRLIINSSSAGFNVRFVNNGKSFYICSTDNFDIDYILEESALKLRDRGLGIESGLILKNKENLRIAIEGSIKVFVEDE